VIYNVSPTAKVRQTQSDRWKQRPCVMRYRAFADKLRALGCTLQDGDSIIFWIAMPRSWSSKKRSAHVGAPHRSRPDLDNLLGGTMDAVMPKGDSHVSALGRIEKRWALAGAIEVLRSVGQPDAVHPCESQSEPPSL